MASSRNAARVSRWSSNEQQTAAGPSTSRGHTVMASTSGNAARVGQHSSNAQQTAAGPSTSRGQTVMASTSGNAARVGQHSSNEQQTAAGPSTSRGHTDMASTSGNAARAGQRSSSEQQTAGPSTSRGRDASSSACSWDVVRVLSEELDCVEWAVNNTVQMLEADNSIPFIARYRKEQTNNMPVETLRELQSKFDDLKAVQTKVVSVMKSVEKLKKMTAPLRDAFRAAQTLTEVEHLYAPFKPGSKKTLAERAKERGLEPTATGILQYPARSVDLSQGQDEQDVSYIIADVIAKDKEIMDHVRSLCKSSIVRLESSQKTKKPSTKDTSDTDPDKFKLYFNFSEPVKFVKPHQVLAINRGERLKVLNVKINIPDEVKRRFTSACQRKWIPLNTDQYVCKLLNNCIKDAYTRLVHPLMARHQRSHLTKNAEKASTEVFASNLKRLLMTPPVRGKVVMGVDPGFRNGCKIAVTSVTSGVLETAVLYLHTHGNNTFREVHRLRDLILRHRCQTVAIGNGTACRETETLFSKQIKQKTFAPLNVSFCIVSEAGASIYSASPEAVKELPDMDVTLRGAVSIARRLQDPLAELVKIEPKHIGIGMYQHDISENQLKSALDGVVEDCVSFVGVDINTCSEFLLRKVAGLNATRAKNIVAWRDSSGPFVNRQQLQGIKGVGPKTYEQCAGFVRILPETRGSGIVKLEPMGEPEKTTTGMKRKAASKPSAKSKKAKLSAEQLVPNSLDMTSIHPESYHIATRVLQEAGVNKENIGQEAAITQLNRFAARRPEDLARQFDVGVPTMTLILDALKQPIGYDMRNEFEQPLFKQGTTSIEDLKVGDILTGRVENTTHFGAFVDIGVGRSGLVHSSQMCPRQMNGKRSLELGDRIQVAVVSLDLHSKKIGLRLTQLL